MHRENLYNKEQFEILTGDCGNNMTLLVNMSNLWRSNRWGKFADWEWGQT